MLASKISAASTINNLTFYKNRLGILSEENVVFSENGEFYNFFKTIRY